MQLISCELLLKSLYLHQNGVFDQDSFIDFFEEDNI